MNVPSLMNPRLTRLRRRIRDAQRLMSGGVALMVLVALLRTAQAVPGSRGDVLCEWLACVATVSGWALLWLGMHFTTRSFLVGIEREVGTRKFKRVTHDNPSLHRAVWALAKQTDAGPRA